MRRGYSYNTRAAWQGTWLALTPLPLLLTQTAEPPPLLLGGGIAAVAAGIAGAAQLFRHPKLARLLGAFFLCGSFVIALPYLVADPFAALLASVAMVHFAFVLQDLRRNPLPDLESCDRFRALGGAAGTLLLIVLSLFGHLAGGSWFRLGIALSAVIALTLFRRWGVRTGHPYWSSWFSHLARLGIMALLFVRGSTPFAFFAALSIVGVLAVRGNNQSRREYWWDFLLAHPARVMFVTFFLLAFCGTLLLLVPSASSAPGAISVVDAAFTAVSAVCVTGLTVLNTGSDFTFGGQLAILLLIQLGGLGIMSIATVALGAIGRRISIRQEYLMSSMTDTEQRDLSHALHLVFRFTFLTEAIGAAILTSLFLADGAPFGKALFEGCFTAVSGFCNAGFGLRNGNLVPFQDSPAILATVGTLIVLGGLAPATSLLIPAWLRGKTVPAAARLTLVATAVLIVLGTLFMLVFEWNGALAGLNFFDKFCNAAFQSITLRTAGFNSVELGGITAPTLIMMVLFMFIGGSPGSTAGGIKTTTAAVLAVTFWANITNRGDVVVSNRRIPAAVIYRALTITLATFLLLLAMSMMLVITQPIAADKLIFEAASALGTVGLSIGATAELDAMGKVIVILTMFAGRIGPVTLFMLVNDSAASGQSRCPNAKITLT